MQSPGGVDYRSPLAILMPYRSQKNSNERIVNLEELSFPCRLVVRMHHDGLTAQKTAHLDESLLETKRSFPRDWSRRVHFVLALHVVQIQCIKH